jgi:hypothetical protein
MVERDAGVKDVRAAEKHTTYYQQGERPLLPKELSEI